MQRFIGVMSGTSADGVDAVVARFSAGRFECLEASQHWPYPAALRESLIALGQDAQARCSLAELAQLDVAVADQIVHTVQALLTAARLEVAAMTAIGSHGQTIFHDPTGIQSSWQLGDPSRIAARTGIAVAADFRRMDIALGGQGAPLVPAFHQAIFSSQTPTTVVNIGGIANVTQLGAGRDLAATGFDCGPGNAMMDEWARLHLGTAYDAGGALAARGTVQSELLQAWLAEPYFALPGPKSTGRDLFKLQWATARAPQPLAHYRVEDVQATLCELTARTVAGAVPADHRRLLVCGGGAFNTHLLQRLAALLPQITIESTAAQGLAPQWVEAAAFAWLAHQRVHGETGNLPSVTGARSACVLGGWYQPYRST